MRKKDGSEMKLLAPGINKLWPNLERDVHKKTERTTFYEFIASSRQLVLSGGLTIDPNGNGILQRIIWR